MTLSNVLWRSHLQEGRYCGHVVEDENDLVVAIVPDQVNVEEKARLIASAPRLLAACKLVVGAIMAGDPDAFQRAHEACAAAVAEADDQGTDRGLRPGS